VAFPETALRLAPCLTTNAWVVLQTADYKAQRNAMQGRNRKLPGPIFRMTSNIVRAHVPSPHEPALGQRGVGGTSNNDVIVHGNAQQAAGLDELACNPDVLGAGLRIA